MLSTEKRKVYETSLQQLSQIENKQPKKHYN